MQAAMKFFSTNDASNRISLKEAVLHAYPEDKGLYLPTEIPRLPKEFFDNISNLSLQEISFQAAKALIGEALAKQQLEEMINEAINFDAPLIPLTDCAFDFGTVPWPHPGLQGFWSPLHGPPHERLYSGRQGEAHHPCRYFGRYRQRCRPRLLSGARHRGDGLLSTGTSE